MRRDLPKDFQPTFCLGWFTASDPGWSWNLYYLPVYSLNYYSHSIYGRFSCGKYLIDFLFRSLKYAGARVLFKVGNSLTLLLVSIFPASSHPVIIGSLINPSDPIFDLLIPVLLTSPSEHIARVQVINLFQRHPTFSSSLPSRACSNSLLELTPLANCFSLHCSTAILRCPE